MWIHGQAVSINAVTLLLCQHRSAQRGIHTATVDIVIRIGILSCCQSTPSAILIRSTLRDRGKITSVFARHRYSPPALCRRY